MKNWKMDDDQINELMSYVSEAEEEDEEPTEGAENWIDENQELVDEWLEK